MPLDVVKTLQEIVSIPSVNPMGGKAEGPEFLEGRLTDHLENLFQQLHLPYVRQPVLPDRENIVARLDGDRDELLLYEVHQDTVRVEGMTIDPWNPELRDGRVYGRGSCDIKGGMAAMLAAITRIAEENPGNRPTLLLACCVNEEFGYSGSEALPRLWEQPCEATDGKPIFPRRPDAAVVAEPTLLDVVVAHNGTIRWKLRTTGRAAHTSQPHLGENAIYKMSRIALAIEKYSREVIPTLRDHPLCGYPALTLSRIQGGIGINTVPDECIADIDRRLIPDEDPQAAMQSLDNFLQQETGLSPQDYQHQEPIKISYGLPDKFNGLLADRVVETVLQREPTCNKIGVPYGTDAAMIQAAGVPAVVFGPGSIDQAHTCDEWVEVDQLQRASEIYYRFAKEGLAR